MKIRNDFVSNSSSSSFVLFGVEFEIDKLIEQLKASPFENVKAALEKVYGSNKEQDSEDYEEYEDNEYESYDVIEELLNYDNYVIDRDSGTIVIGKNPRDMKDDETLLDFKKSIVNMIKLLGIDKNEKDVALWTCVDVDGNIQFD